MAKIYNEIVIDMNPESSTFEETLYEDSFEYSGDLMLAGHTGAPVAGNPDSTMDELLKDKMSHDQEWAMFSPEQKAEYANSLGNFLMGRTPEEIEEIQTDWGAANITKDMFINPDGTPKTIQEIYNKLDPILTGMTGNDLIAQIKDMLPQYTGVAEEELGFAKEAYKADLYGLQKEAGAVGGAARSVYGGMAGGARGAIGQQAGIKKGFEAAGAAYEKDIYGLQKTAGAEFETDVAGMIADIEEPFAAPGTPPKVTPYTETGEGGILGTGYARAGGKVPDRRETFLDILAQLPDAGGT